MSENGDLPEGTLQAKQRQLKKVILKDRSKGWQLLQEEPTMVIALTQVKRDLETSQSEEAQAFIEEYNSKAQNVFKEDNSIERYGIALSAEFLAEYWRNVKGSVELISVNQAVLDRLDVLLEACDLLPEDEDDTTLTRQIVEYSRTRLIEFDNYDRMKSLEHLSNLQPTLLKLIAEISSDSIGPEFLALSYLTTGSIETMGEFRRLLAREMLEKSKSMFEDLDEQDKFIIAPWIGVFEQISQSSTHQPEELR